MIFETRTPCFGSELFLDLSVILLIILHHRNFTKNRKKRYIKICRWCFCHFQYLFFQIFQCFYFENSQQRELWNIYFRGTGSREFSFWKKFNNVCPKQRDNRTDQTLEWIHTSAPFNSIRRAFCSGKSLQVMCFHRLFPSTREESARVKYDEELESD